MSCVAFLIWSNPIHPVSWVWVRHRRFFSPMARRCQGHWTCQWLGTIVRLLRWLALETGGRLREVRLQGTDSTMWLVPWAWAWHFGLIWCQYCEIWENCTLVDCVCVVLWFGTLNDRLVNVKFYECGCHKRSCLLGDICCSVDCFWCCAYFFVRKDRNQKLLKRGHLHFLRSS